MTAPTNRPGGLDANSRGIAVLVVAVVVGFLLLSQAGAGGGGGTKDDVASQPTTVDTSGLNGTNTTSTTFPTDTTPGTTSTTTGSRTNGEIKVAVLNGGGPAGSAAKASTDVVGKGYGKGSVGNATTKLDQTTVYYADGYQAEATAVASALGKAPSAVQAMPSSSLGDSKSTDNVVIVLGKDWVGSNSSSGSTTSTTTG